LLCRGERLVGVGEPVFDLAGVGEVAGVAEGQRVVGDGPAGVQGLFLGALDAADLRGSSTPSYGAGW
jgi:hypothetical protein